MPSAATRLVAAGFAPRTLPLALAAAYVGYGPSEFRRLIAAGKYPAAIDDGGKPARWLVEALDRALRRNAGLDADSTPSLKSAIDRRTHAAEGSLSRKATQ